MPEYYLYRLIVLVHVFLKNMLQFMVKDCLHTHRKKQLFPQTIIPKDIHFFAYRSSHEVLKKNIFQQFNFDRLKGPNLRQKLLDKKKIYYPS